jgi:hypothetical protein
MSRPAVEKLLRDLEDLNEKFLHLVHHGTGHHLVTHHGLGGSVHLVSRHIIVGGHHGLVGGVHLVVHHVIVGCHSIHIIAGIPELWLKVVGDMSLVEGVGGLWVTITDHRLSKVERSKVGREGRVSRERMFRLVSHNPAFS